MTYTQTTYNLIDETLEALSNKLEWEVFSVVLEKLLSLSTTICYCLTEIL
jgi:hypothetical protein